MSKNPTKAELKAEIRSILKDANLEETAAKKVRLQLEENLKCDLSSRKKEVDDLVMEYVNSQASSEEEDEEDDDYDGKQTKKGGRKAKGNSDYEEDEEEEEDDENDDDEDYSEEEKPKGRKSGGKRGTPAKRGPTPKKKKRTADSEDESEDEDEEEGSDEDYKPQKGAKGAKGGKAGGKKRKNDSDSDSDEDWKQDKPAKGKKGAGGAKKASGYTRPYTLSADLAALCGAESLPRHEVVKKIWAIIKERNLYDPKNKQFAICDADLQKVIGVKRFRTFGMLKYLKPHFIN